MVRALRLQALEEAAAQAAHRGPARADGPGRERRARSTPATASRSCSRSRATTTPRPWSRSRAPPPGSGGILRDVFALGARPIAVLDSLRFGDISTPRTRYLLERVVAGIGAYGNSVGVPTVGGEIYFEPPYEQNCLVNAMCVGLAPARAPDPLGRRGTGQRAGADRRAHRAATASAARACWRPRSWARARRTSARPCRSATRSRRAA